MAIVPLVKYTLYGPAEQKASVVDQLQELGCTHLVNLQGKPSERPQLTSREARKILNYLNTSPVKRRCSRNTEDYDRHQIVQQALEIIQQSEDLIDERDRLQRAIARRRPWGEFSVPPPEQLGGLRLWFYELDPKQIAEIPGNVQLVVINHERNLVRLLVISPTSPAGMPDEPVELAVQSLSALKRELEGVEDELDELHWKRYELSRWREVMAQDLDEADDEAARDAATRQLWENRALFAIQAWIPKTRLHDVTQLANANRLAFSQQAPENSDRPPTLLQNSAPVRGSETCLTFYQMPGYHTWDPTGVVFFSLCLFFAMIISDAGYGLVMGAIFLGSYNSLRKSPSLAPLRNLFVGIILSTIAYGVLIGSYFGLEPGSDSWLSDLRILHGGEPLVNNQQLMMIVSIGVGVVHLTLANLLVAWTHRRSTRWLGSLGWAMVITGAYGYGLCEYFTVPDHKPLALNVIAVGAICILLFSSRLTVATMNPRTHLRRFAAGVFQFGSIPKAFGDSLSYLRLFALGLASGQLAMTFNGLAENLSHQSGVGILLALIVLVLGHSINFLLGLMGGLVHGLRLNCIEFLDWGLDDDGYPFQPFRKKAAKS